MASSPPAKPKRGFRKFLSDTYHAVARSPSPSRSHQSREISDSATNLSPPARTNTIAATVQHSQPVSSSISNTSASTAQLAGASKEHGASSLLDHVNLKVDQIGLKPALQALHRSAIAFLPLQSATEALISCLDATTKNKSEYEVLASELKTLANFLSQHMEASQFFQTSESLEYIAVSIEREANLIENKQTRSAGSRLVNAIMDEDDLIGHLRRIESLVRQLQTNVSLSTWGIAKAQLVDTRLKDLNPAKLARYDTELSKGLTRRTCTENTRVAVLSGLNDWSHDQSGADIYWMDGMAGTGKTTIACSFSQQLEEQKRLAASFFCSRTTPECRIVGRVVPTIAYQLARYSIPYRGTVYEVLENDPDIGLTNIGKQFERLLREPLMKVKAAMPENLVVVIDALDECEDRNGVQRLLELLFGSAAELPIKFFVTSRPEPEIYRTMVSQAPNSRTVLHLHEIETSLVQADIALYLAKELGRFMKPSVDQIEQLSHRSGNLFIYAATLVRHVQLGIRLGDYQKRLNSLLAAAPRSTKQYAQLDELYATVLKSALNGDDLDDEAANDIKAVLQTVVCVQEPVDLETLAALAGLDDVEHAVSALQPLRSVLHLSENSGLVSTLHASFPDFMFSQERSGSFFCDAEAYSQVLARQCFTIMQHQLRFNICNLESSFVADKDVDDLQDRITRCISHPLYYACRYWADHLCSCKSSELPTPLVEGFLTIRLLFWMEVLNLKGVMGIGVEVLSKATQWLQVEETSSEVIELIRLAEGARKFLTIFAGNAISQSTPHIYTSLLPFCPKSSIISEHYRKQTHGLIEAKGTGVDRWDVDTMPLANWNTGISPIWSVAYSPDRSRVVYGCKDGTIGIRSAYNGSLLVGPVKAHDGCVWGVAFSLNETQVASCGEDRTIRLWNVRNGVAIGEPFRGHSGDVTSISFAPDGGRIASGSRDRTIRIWGIPTGTPLPILFEGHTDWVVAVAFSPDGTRIVSGSTDCTVRVWSSIDGAPVAGPFIGHTGSVRSVAFSPDNTRVVSGSDDQTVRLWAANSAAPIPDPLEGHTHWVTAIAFSPDGTRIASGSRDSTIRMWDLSSETPLSAILEGHTDTVTTVGFSPDGTRIISGSYDCTVRVWSVLATSLASRPPQGHTGWVLSVAVSPDGSRIVSGSYDNTVRLWDAQTGTSIDNLLHRHTDAVYSVAFSPNSTLIASGSYDHTIQLWSLHDKALVFKPFKGHTDEVTSVAFSPDGTWLVSGSADKTVRVWSIPDGDLVIGPLSGHADVVMSVVFSPDSKCIFSGSDDCTIRVWNTSDGTPAADAFNGHTQAITSISVSPISTLIASGSEDRTVRLWNPDDGTPATPPLRGHTDTVYSVAFSPDGAHVISGSKDHTVRLWNSSDGTPICSPFEGHTSPVYSVAFSPDGAFAISGSRDCTIRFWNTQDIPSLDPDFKHSVPSPNPVGVKHSISNPFGRWSIQEDGWVMGSDQRLLFWLPIETLRSLLTPHCYMVIGRFGSMEVDLSDALLGNDWRDCYIHD